MNDQNKYYLLNEATPPSQPTMTNAPVKLVSQNMVILKWTNWKWKITKCNFLFCEAEDSGWTSQEGSDTHLDRLAGLRLELHI